MKPYRSYRRWILIAEALLALTAAFLLVSSVILLLNIVTLYHLLLAPTIDIEITALENPAVYSRELCKPNLYLCSNLR
jgi:hypothetical protein